MQDVLNGYLKGKYMDDPRRGPSDLPKEWSWAWLLRYTGAWTAFLGDGETPMATLPSVIPASLWLLPSKSSSHNFHPQLQVTSLLSEAKTIAQHIQCIFLQRRAKMEVITHNRSRQHEEIKSVWYPLLRLWALFGTGEEALCE